MANPYQPPRSIDTPLGNDAAVMASCRSLSRRLRHHAEEHYLLHLHLPRLLFGSIVLVVLSTAAIVGALMIHSALFLPTLIAVMVVSALIYLAMVADTKRRLRLRCDQLGLASGAETELICGLESTEVVTVTGNHQWPNGQIRIRRTPRGVLVCPEPLAYVFVPKRATFNVSSYREFVRILESRLRRTAH